MILCACNDNATEQTYYGTYKAATNESDKVIINKDGFQWGDKTYPYSVSDNKVTITGEFTGGQDTIDFYLFENDQIICIDIITPFDRGTLSVRNGRFSVSLMNFDNNYSVDDVYSFNSNGTYSYTNTSYFSINDTGSYTMKNGLLIMDGTYTMSGKSHKSYWYVSESGNIYLAAVYVKEINLFIPDNANGNTNNNTGSDIGNNDSAQTQPLDKSKIIFYTALSIHDEMVFGINPDQYIDGSKNAYDYVLYHWCWDDVDLTAEITAALVSAGYAKGENTQCPMR